MKTVYKWLVSVISVVFVLIGLGGFYQFLKERKKQRHFPPPGRLYDIGGFRLHAVCQGQGTPTVIFEAGLSCSHLDWSRVIPSVAQKTQVFAYDRGGYGWSDPCPIPRNGLKMVEELHTLLQEAGVSGSIILVGHSYGGLLVRLYASQYPEDVAGIVLLDGSLENQRTQFPKTKSWKKRIHEDIVWQIYRLRPILARIGFLRLRNLPNGFIDALPEKVKPVATALGLGSRAYDWLWTEEPSINATNEEVRSSNLPDYVRTTILVAGKSILIEEFQDIWIRLQKEQSQKMPNSVFEIVEDSGHFIHLEKPEVVINAILQMVDNIRNSGK